MIVERHYDDETLIGLLGSNLDAIRDPHLAVCASCSDSLEAYRAIVDVLGQDAAWDLRDLRQEPVPETIATLRMSSAVMNVEGETAKKAVAELLGRPRSSWPAAVASSLELHSPSAVSELVAASETAIDRDPSEAVALAEAATRVAQMLRSDSHSGDSIPRAIGVAWRQYAYAAFYVGDFIAAGEAVAKSQAAFESCVVSDYDLARLSIVRGVIYSAQDRHEEARAEARRAAAVFEAFGDRQRSASARMTEAYSLIEQFRYQEALAILEMVEREFSTDIENWARAMLAMNQGICHAELGPVSEAFDHYSVAAAIFDEIGSPVEAARVRHNVACLLAAQGRLADAKARFRSLRTEFRRLGMGNMAVSADLDLAAILLAEQAHDEAEALCATAVEQFQKSGLGATTQGLVALSYLREAAAQRRATPEAARHVRRFIERLPKEPQLLFAPPPLPLL